MLVALSALAYDNAGRLAVSRKAQSSPTSVANFSSQSLVLTRGGSAARCPFSAVACGTLYNVSKQSHVCVLRQGGDAVQTQVERWLAEGRALVAHKDYALALVPLNRVTREACIGPTSSDAWRLKSQALIALGHLEQALVAADHAAQDQPDDLRALKQRAKVYELLRRYPEAIADRERAAQIEPTNAQAWEQLGTAHPALGNDAVALHAFDAALALQSDMARALHGKAVGLDHLGRRNESLAAYARARQVIPGDDPLYIWAVTNSALALQSAHHLTEALALAEQAIRLDAPPDDRARAWCIAGNILMDLHCYPEALTKYERACTIAPGYATGWHGKGDALAALNQPEAALTAFEEALRLDPSDRQLQQVHQSALAHMLLTQTPRLAADAPEFTQIADPAIWSEQVQRFARLRRAPEVEAAANQVLRLDPDDADAYMYKAVAQVWTKRYREAWTNLRQAWRTTGRQSRRH